MAVSHDRHLLFGYGSLLNLESMSRTLERSLGPEDVQVVSLEGYVRTWRYVTWSQFAIDREGEPTRTVFLDLREKARCLCNGLVVPVRSSEWERLDRREKGYERIEVTGLVQGEWNEPVYTYISREAFRYDAVRDQGAVVAENYSRIIEQGIQKLGSEFRPGYERSTEPHSFPLRPGDCWFADPDQESAARRGGE